MSEHVQGPAPRSGSPTARWSALGRLLPRSVRERVFEPAFADLLRESLEAHVAGASRTPFPLRVLGTYLGCLPPAIVRVFVVRGKPTRFVRVTGAVVVFVVVLGFVSQWVGYGYG